MTRAFLLILTIFSYLFLALGAPTAESIELDKRITHTGRGTWFHTGHGNCGDWNVDSDHILAIPKSLYDQNGGSNCNQYVRITNTATGKTVYGLTEDSCPSCGPGDLACLKNLRHSHKVWSRFNGISWQEAGNPDYIDGIGGTSLYSH